MQETSCSPLSLHRANGDLTSQNDYEVETSGVLNFGQSTQYIWFKITMGIFC